MAPYPYCLHCKARQHAPGGQDWYKASCFAGSVLTGIMCLCWHADMQPVQIRPNIPPAEPYEARVCCNGPMEGLKALLHQQASPQLAAVPAGCSVPEMIT